MVVRETLQAQQYDALSRTNLQEFAGILAKTGFGKLGAAAVVTLIKPEELRRMSKATIFMRDAVQEGIAHLGAQTVKNAFDEKLPSVEEISASVLEFAGGRVGASVASQVAQRLVQHAPQVGYLRQAVLMSITEEVVSGMASTGGSLIKTGVGNMTAADIVAAFGQTIAGAVSKGVVKGTSTWGSELRANDLPQSDSARRGK
jgi:hypothetical protein